MPTGNPLKYCTKIRVSWGHCDAAEIIYYPNYFEWFDQCFHGLLGVADLDQRKLRKTFTIVGTGAINATGQFVSAATYGDILETCSYIESWSERSFTVYHRFEAEGRLVVEGREVRLFLARPGESESDITAIPIPEAFKARMSGGKSPD